MSWMREARAVFLKEARTEWRTRVALSGIGLFTLGSLTLIGLALAGKSVDSELLAGLLWIVMLFTAATGLGRAFVQETERGTALALRLHSRATAVWTGKFVANAALLLGLMLLATPVVLTIVSVKAVRAVNYGALACVLVLGTLGVASVFTTMAALVAQTTARGGLLAALAFPLLVPAFQAGLHGTIAALSAQKAWESAGQDSLTLGPYFVIVTVLALMLFEVIWNE
jgi:heme exporter protein B